MIAVLVVEIVVDDVDGRDDDVGGRGNIDVMEVAGVISRRIGGEAAGGRKERVEREIRGTGFMTR